MTDRREARTGRTSWPRSLFGFRNAVFQRELELPKVGTRDDDAADSGTEQMAGSKLTRLTALMGYGLRPGPAGGDSQSARAMAGQGREVTSYGPVARAAALGQYPLSDKVRSLGPDFTLGYGM